MEVENKSLLEEERGAHAPAAAAHAPAAAARAPAAAGHVPAIQKQCIINMEFETFPVFFSAEMKSW